MVTPEFKPENRGSQTDFEQLLQSFDELSRVSDPIRFPLEFEKQQKLSGLRLGTFREAYRAWTSTKEQGGPGDATA